MRRLNGRMHRWSLRPLTFAVMGALLLTLALVSASVAAEPFVGSPPLPAHESAWILIDGDDRAAGTTATIDAAERFASKILKLHRDKSRFRFSPKTHDLASMEKSFGRSGALGKGLTEVSPAVIVLMIEGKVLHTGLGYGKSDLTSEWIDKRIEDVNAACPSALVVVVAEPCAPGTRQKLEAAASKRAKVASDARKPASPLYLILNELPAGRSAAAPLSSVRGLLPRDGPAAHAMAKVFPGADIDPVALGGSVFLTGLLGGAEDTGGNGYDVVEIKDWMLKALKSSRSGQGSLAVGEVWGDESSAIAAAYPLKRRKYTVGVCVAFATPLPALPNEDDRARAARTKADLHHLAQTLEKSVREALPKSKAVEIKARDPSNLPQDSTATASGPAACSATTARYAYDIWVKLFLWKEGYVLQASRVRTHDTIMASPDPPPDREKTRGLLVELGRKIVRPMAIYEAVPESEIVAADEKTATTDASPGFVDADALYRQGREAFEKEDYKGALALFKKSNDAHGSPEALFGVAVSEEQLGMRVEARRDLRELVGRYPPEHGLVVKAKERLALLDAREQAALEAK